MVLLLTALLAFAKPTDESLRSRLEAKVRSSGVPASEFTLYVASAESEPAVVLDVNARKALIPASVTKLITASAVLDAFPPGTRFKTTLWSDGKNLYLKGGGDPSFVSENMWFLVNHFTRAGIKRIEGDIVVDDGLFDPVRFDGSREDARVDRAYDAPVGAMSFNWNSVNVYVRPGKAGEPASVFLDPQNDYTKLVNRTKTSKGSGQNISVERKKGGDESGDTLVVSGTIGADRDEHVVYKNITKPDLWAGENLKAFLAQRGITVAGRIRAGAVPPAARQVAESESKAVELILADMNKFSNNYVAEMLTKNLASSKEKPARLSTGVEMINQHLRKLELPEKEYVILNPSGLTRDNRMSAFALWKVLHHLRNDFRVQPELLTSLPIAGVDGTLKKRMKGSKAERWVRAKTGLLTGVTALAGYAGREDGRVYTFVFIHNGSRDESKVRRLFDDWLVSLLD
ncbi:MAG: D-alanyl-D-alanine carboxypeptidase/D-alanyl-D-alanine-endopeptidase [Bdellovibrionaceae bacterium]|nr:D-alanyl-D-alanine carboxypeptidase/D-alanyl-D-alanine-endopeptidase [Pseudobdellovibrionaceae bacterium]